MRSIPRVRRALFGALALTTLAGCEDQLPTLGGTDRLPQGAAPTTVELLVPAAEYLVETSRYGDFTRPVEAPYLLVANAFDGRLDAHVLGRFTGFPDSIIVAGDTVRDFSYAGARITAAVDSAASTTGGPVRVQVWELAQAWDSTTATWLVADAGAASPVAWTQPGGTRGALLAEAVWTPADTAAAADTLVWNVAAAAAARLALPDHPGVLIRTDQSGARLELESLGIRVDLVPAADPDTTVTRTLSRRSETFVFNPPLVAGDETIPIGGAGAERVVLTLDLSAPVPACAAPATTPGCGTVALRDVILNRATLELQPLAVPEGHRPLTRTPLFVRRVLEPALGRSAPLGEVLALDSVPLSSFVAGASPPRVDLVLTSAIRNYVAADSARGTVALLAEREGERFGTAWFRAAPSLRLVYTLPQPLRLR